MIDAKDIPKCLEKYQNTLNEGKNIPYGQFLCDYFGIDDADLMLAHSPEHAGLIFYKKYLKK